MSIDETTIIERKETLISDLQLVQGRILENDKRKLEDVALVNALTGAIQQCDDFLKKLNNEDGDVENTSEEE